ncbi:hypothetical protein N8Z76_00375 [Gammaproteobacteria bacterium]|nr:hypothetical protein [Gammaproteobacteria bacterium]
MTELILLINAALKIKGAIDGIPAEKQAENMAYIDAAETMISFVSKKISEAERGGIITANQQADLAREILTIRQRVGISPVVLPTTENNDIEEESIDS